MKRSKYILYIWAIGGILAFTGCNDFLDRSPQGQFTEDDNPGALAEGKIFNIYTMMRNFNITAGTPAFAIHCSVPKIRRKEVFPVTGRNRRQCMMIFSTMPAMG